MKSLFSCFVVLVLLVAQANAAPNPITQAEADGADTAQVLAGISAYTDLFNALDNVVYKSTHWAALSAQIGADPLVPQVDKDSLMHDCNVGKDLFWAAVYAVDPGWPATTAADANAALGDTAYAVPDYATAHNRYHQALGQYTACTDIGTGMGTSSLQIYNDGAYDMVFLEYQMIIFENSN